METMLGFLRMYIDNPEMPIEPIVDHMIEERIRANLIDGPVYHLAWLMANGEMWDWHKVCHLASDLNDRLEELGHHELADWIPF